MDSDNLARSRKHSFPLGLEADTLLQPHTPQQPLPLHLLLWIEKSGHLNTSLSGLQARREGAGSLSAHPSPRSPSVWHRV